MYKGFEILNTAKVCKVERITIISILNCDFCFVATEHWPGGSEILPFHNLVP
jgi:hypothetical protein